MRACAHLATARAAPKRQSDSATPARTARRLPYAAKAGARVPRTGPRPSREPPGTSAGSIRPMRRQPLDSSQLRGMATSHSRPASAYRPGGGARPFHPSNHSPELAPSSTTGGTRRRRREALHTVRQAHLALRLHQELRVVVLDRVVHHPEPWPLRTLTQRLAERSHEPPAAQRRHIVQHAHGDQHRAMPRHPTPVAVRNPRMTRTRPTRTGARATTATGAKLDTGLARLPATFRCHERGFPGGLRSGESLSRITVRVNSTRAHVNAKQKCPLFSKAEMSPSGSGSWTGVVVCTGAGERFPRAVHGRDPPEHQSAGGRAVENAGSRHRTP